MSNEIPSENYPHDLPRDVPPRDTEQPLNPEHSAWLSEAVVKHATGDPVGASVIRGIVAEEMAPDDPKKPGVIATQTFSARSQVNSIDELASLLKSTRNAYRMSVQNVRFADKDSATYTVARGETPATQMHYSVLLGGLALHLDVNGDPAASRVFERANEHIQVAWRGTRKLHTEYTGIVHQTRINMARRRAAMLGMTGKPVRGMMAAASAVALSPLSESERFARNSTPAKIVSPNGNIVEFTKKDRRHAKIKAMLGGIAAGMVSAVNLPGIRRIGGRSAAVKLYAKMEGMKQILTMPYDEQAATEVTAEYVNKKA